MKILRVFITATVLSALLSACAAQEESPIDSFAEKLRFEERLELKSYELGEPVNSIINSRINGWSNVDDRHIIVSSGVRDDYLVTFRNNCREARMASNVGFTHTAGRVTTTDKVIVTAPGGFVDHCYIQSINRVTKIRKSSEDTN